MYLFIFAVAVVILGLYSFQNLLSALRNEVRKEMQLIVFSHKKTQKKYVIFHQENLESAHWLNSKEFVLQDCLYDVVKIDTTKNQVTYFCVFDRKETLIAKTQSVINHVLQLGNTIKTPCVGKMHFVRNTKHEVFCIFIISHFFIIKKSSLSHFFFYYLKKTNQFLDHSVQPPEFGFILNLTN